MAERKITPDEANAILRKWKDEEVPVRYTHKFGRHFDIFERVEITRGTRSGGYCFEKIGDQSSQVIIPPDRFEEIALVDVGEEEPALVFRERTGDEEGQDVESELTFVKIGEGKQKPPIIQ